MRSWWVDIALFLVPKQIPAAAVPILSDLLCYCSIVTFACIWYIDFLPPTLFGVSCFLILMKLMWKWQPRQVACLPFYSTWTQPPTAPLVLWRPWLRCFVMRGKIIRMFILQVDFGNYKYKYFRKIRNHVLLGNLLTRVIKSSISLYHLHSLGISSLWSKEEPSPRNCHATCSNLPMLRRGGLSDGRWPCLGGQSNTL